MTIACDLQDVVTLRDGYREDFVEYADMVFFSAVNQSDPTPLIAELLRWRPGLIVVSGRGAQGCTVGTPAGIRHFGPVAMDLPVIDTNGAGDGLAVGFLAAMCWTVIRWKIQFGADKSRRATRVRRRPARRS